MFISFSPLSLLKKSLFFILLFLAACSKYGTTPSTRVVEFNEEAGVMPKIPKGGGVYKIGKPYKIAGQWFVPKENENYSSIGIASWYGTDFHGRLTANGEIFDMNAMTAAHPTLPIPSLVKVTNLENGKTAIIRVNDRGPFAKNREIDLSRAAAGYLGFKNKGTAKVKVEYLKKASLANVEFLEKQLQSPKERQYATAQKRIRNIQYAKKRNTNITSNENYTQNDVVKNDSLRKIVRAPVTRRSTLNTKLTSRDSHHNTPLKIYQTTSQKSHRQIQPENNTYQSYYVQIGAFGNQDNVDKAIADLRRYVYKIQIEPVESSGKILQRVRLGPIYSKQEAINNLTRIASDGWINSRLIIASQ